MKIFGAKIFINYLMKQKKAQAIAKSQIIWLIT